MIRPLLIALSLCAVPLSALADTLVAARTIRAQTILSAADLALIANDVPGALGTIEDAVGLEAKVMLYSGRPISDADIGPAAVVERNAVVILVFHQGGLSITADGRALDRAAPGEVLRVMNLSSKTIVSGTVAPDGTIHVGGLAGF